MDHEATQIASPTFISDQAAPEDFFGSHERVARVIARVIQSSVQTRVVGILGPWGSGKSTIVRLVEGKLGQPDLDNKKTFFFTYDTWLHQNDPPRRSFIESLIRFLVSQGLTTAKEWEYDLDRLNRRVEDNDITTTPTLTLPGKLITASLLITAYGWKLADSKLTTTWFGHTLSVATIGYFLIAAPVFAAIAAYVLLRRTGDTTAVFSMFVNKAVERIKTRTIKTPDPTAIEFQEVFKRVMASVQATDRRFVFVIDNLDRIPETEAIAIWSTVRSFFVDETKNFNQAQKTEGSPTVLLPLDPSAIHKMYGKAKEDAKELAQSFIDKTFDLVFRVNPPVQSGWHGYLAEKLRNTFNGITDEDIFIATKLYEVWIIETSSGVTPRNINALINEIATLQSQWQNEIPFSTLCYYAINRPGIENDFQRYLNSDDLYIKRFDERWAEGIAAIHYGVPPDRVLQVLLLPKINSSLYDNSDDEVAFFKDLSVAVGFEAVLQKAIEDGLTQQPYDIELGARASALMAAADLKRSPRLIEIEKILRTSYSNPKPWREMSPLTASGITAQLVSCPANEQPLFTYRVEATLQGVHDTFPAIENNAKHWQASAEAIVRGTANARTDVQTLRVPGDATFFLSVADLTAVDSILLSYLRPSSTIAAVINQASLDASGSSFKLDSVPRLQKLSKIKTSWDWSPLVDAAGQHIEAGARNDVADMNALDLLGRMRMLAPNKALNAKLKSLSEGTLLDALYNAHSQNQRELEAALICLLILVNPTFQQPTAIGNSEAGRQLAADMTTTLNDRPELYDIVDNRIRLYGTFAEFVASSGKNAEISKILKPIFSKRVRAKTLGRLPVSDIVERLPIYANLLDSNDQAAFIEQLPEYETFWECMEDGDLNDSKCSIVNYFISKDTTTGEHFRELVLKKASNFDETEWSGRLLDGADPMPAILNAVKFGGQGSTMGDSLLRGLMASFESTLENGAASLSKIKSWFIVMGLLDENRADILLKEIKDKILNAPSNVHSTDIILAGESRLLTGGDFRSRPDDAVRKIVLPLVDRLDASTPWFAENKAEIKGWISRADRSTKEYVVEKLVALSESESSEPATTVAKSLGINLTKKRKQAEQRSEDSGEDKEEDKERTD
ncbi:P-loop NTPase fold protein [Tardiphaga sp. 42S5]|uniref:P-loop NTPase fold protein n=1 Tax=Tardiphaga sp. 42S5 TaxID=1404799 RepID=UPI002A5AC6A3|nr:P-loop NTPase fold protein [Tardiphaga sp. 42S5]WPO41829.1 P-loop NTPase fold protein [Tardiphaga sp. 42S5]